MNGVRLGSFSRFDYCLAVKIAVEGVLGADAITNISKLRVKSFLVGVLINRDGFNAQLLTSANDTHGNFAAVRYEYPPNHKQNPF